MFFKMKIYIQKAYAGSGNPLKTETSICKAPFTLSAGHVISNNVRALSEVREIIFPLIQSKNEFTNASSIHEQNAAAVVSFFSRRSSSTHCVKAQFELKKDSTKKLNVF